MCKIIRGGGGGGGHSESVDYRSNTFAEPLSHDTVEQPANGWTVVTALREAEQVRLLCTSITTLVFPEKE
jgi:hypothetical protein